MSFREAVRVSGPDAAAYLQGQISQDIESLADGEVAWSLVLQPTGKLDAWFRIQRVMARRSFSTSMQATVTPLPPDSVASSSAPTPRSRRSTT